MSGIITDDVEAPELGLLYVTGAYRNLLFPGIFSATPKMLVFW